jgi:hypothetical protein
MNQRFCTHFTRPQNTDTGVFLQGDFWRFSLYEAGGKLRGRSAAETLPNAVIIWARFACFFGNQKPF